MLITRIGGEIVVLGKNAAMKQMLKIAREEQSKLTGEQARKPVKEFFVQLDVRKPYSP